MATKQNLSRKVDYSLLERFTELLICSGCFKKHEHQPVRQLVSGRHRPLVKLQSLLMADSSQTIRYIVFCHDNRFAPYGYESSSILLLQFSESTRSSKPGKNV